MDANGQITPPSWPLGVSLQSVDGQPNGSISIAPGITVLVGPNGSGKTRALRAIKAALIGTNRVAIYGRKVRFLSAGRSSPLEAFRSSVNQPNWTNPSDAAVGELSFADLWSDIESLTGDLLTLAARADLKLKVEARLQQLFDRSIELNWTQYGLTPRITSLRDGGSYAANHEASGILQIVGLLAAIHNNEIGALIIDEPEISLHPQHQAFILEEIERVAGDPIDPTKKLVVVATHAPALLPLRSAKDLPRCVFFNEINKSPAQITTNEPVLSGSKLKSLVGRLGATHRLALFAERVLLVEGPSDETIVTQLARRFDWPLLTMNAQVLPVMGKGEFIEVAKLLGLMNKGVGVLADLDALSDDNTLVNFFSGLPNAAGLATKRGLKSIAILDRDLRTDFGKFLVEHSDAVDRSSQTYENWSVDAPPELVRKRVTLARLLTKPATFEGEAALAASALCQRFDVLLEILAEVGCFFLRAGAIENYYETSHSSEPKPAGAATEAAGFSEADRNSLEDRYVDAFSAIRFIAPGRGVDENRVLRPKLGAAISAVFQSMTNNSTSEELNAMARTTIGVSAEVFCFENKSNQNLKKLGVGIASPLFSRANFPIIVSSNDNVNHRLPDDLPDADF